MFQKWWKYWSNARRTFWSSGEERLIFFSFFCCYYTSLFVLQQWTNPKYFCSWIALYIFVWIPFTTFQFAKVIYQFANAVQYLIIDAAEYYWREIQLIQYYLRIQKFWGYSSYYIHYEIPHHHCACHYF